MYFSKNWGKPAGASLKQSPDTTLWEVIEITRCDGNGLNRQLLGAGARAGVFCKCVWLGDCLRVIKSCTTVYQRVCGGWVYKTANFSHLKSWHTEIFLMKQICLMKQKYWAFDCMTSKRYNHEYEIHSLKHGNVKNMKSNNCKTSLSPGVALHLLLLRGLARVGKSHSNDAATALRKRNASQRLLRETVTW